MKILYYDERIKSNDGCKSWKGMLYDLEQSDIKLVNSVIYT